MRRTKLYVLVALLLSALAPTAHAQTGLADTRPVKPVMMLLVDTSGSMEHKPDTTGAGACKDCDPVCSNNAAADATQKNRWAITLEALTGTFTSFQCTRVNRSVYAGAYDQNYFMPHYDFTTSSLQASNGVLDVYAKRLKFGLMTFDGVLTTINGATLVPHATYGGNAAFKTQVLSRDGMFSYPDAVANVGSDTGIDTPFNEYGWKPLSFPGCTAVYGVNAGARGEQRLPAVMEPGALEPVARGESNLEIMAKKDKIKASLLAVRPYGGTPIAGMLDDLRYYLTHDEGVKRGSDPFYSCRKRYAILLTDGAPDSLFRNDPRFQCEASDDSKCAGGICQCPYDTEEHLASDLRTKDGLEKLWVVAFNVNDAPSLAALDKIAQAGGNVDAFRALTAAELRTKLDTLMNIAQPEATSRSVPVVVNTGRAVALNGKQYEVSSGFRVGQTEDEPWEGFLYRRRIECSGASAVSQDLDATKGDLYHVTLNARAGTDRVIHSVMPATAAINGSVFRENSDTLKVPLTSRTNLVKPDGSSFQPLNTDVDVDSASLTQAASQRQTDFAMTLKNFDKSSVTKPEYFKDADSNGSNGTVADRDKIHDYLRGISANRSGRKLGDIYHSNPTVLTPLKTGSDDVPTFDPQLRAFHKQLLAATGPYPAGHFGADGRPGVVFVGTNDGILHAFNLDTWTDKAGTKYGPGHELWGFVPPALFAKLGAAATPSHQWMFDGTPVVKDMIVQSAPSALVMKTILLSAVRGVPAFVALDVTYPEAPVFMWQRSFAYAGDTVGTPALAQVRVKWNNVEQVRAVAILPGGAGTSVSLACDVDAQGRGKLTDGRAKVPCWKMRGRSLYVVDVETGELIQEFDSRHFPSPMSGAVAVDGDRLSLTHAAYLTDEDGVLWRLSMFNTEPNKWRVAPIWDLFHGDAVDRAGNTVQAASTATLWSAGRVSSNAPLLTRDPATGNLTIVVGTGDVDNLADKAANRIVSLRETRTIDSNKELVQGGIVANWKLQLEAGESVTGPIVLLEDTLYFTTFTGPAGGSGDACELGTSRIWGAHVRKATSGLPQPMLMPENGQPPLVLQYPPTSTPNSLLLGLSISRDPICVAGTNPSDPLAPSRITDTGGTSGSSFQVRSMVAGAGGAAIPGSAAPGGGSSQRQFSRTLQLPSLARSVGWASSIE